MKLSCFGPRRLWLLTLVLPTICLAAAARAKEESVATSAPLAWSTASVIKPVGRTGRTPAHTDAIEAAMISGRWTRPTVGEPVALPDGTSVNWTNLALGTNGWFEHAALRGGYAYMAMVVEQEKVLLLEAVGHAMVYVNGEPRAGDTYSYGYVRLPVLLKPGTNDFLFQVARGKLKAAFVAPKASVALDLSDPTLPDLIVGEATKSWGAVVVINATTERRDNLVIRTALMNGQTTDTPLPTIPPMTIRKVGLRLEGKSPATNELGVLELELIAKGTANETSMDTARTSLRVRQPWQTQKRTFVSGIDGSVQYYALNPARPPRADGPRPALFLSLHGASVEAVGQADAYASKPWGHIVAPTNRRPYGFDWEDWGRLDALEVLELAQGELNTDPQRVYLTGHSMGGHGSWQLASTFPDLFAAVGPSAGWISFFSYAGPSRWPANDPVARLLRRAANSSDTLLMATNLAQMGVYILHGDADDNVPVTEARTMREELKTFHHDFAGHEQPGAGHWWETSDEPGAECVDWPPMFDFFARHARPPLAGVRQVNFTTVNPGVSAWSHWAGIEAQISPLEPATVNLRWDPWQRRFTGTTTNVARLALKLDQAPPGDPLRVEVDGQTFDKIPWPAKQQIWLTREDQKWRLSDEPSPAEKGPHRYGPFKAAFRDRMVFVYGTKGTAEENAWAFNKARFDAESFWYRGNASVDVIPDTAFDANIDQDRGVILYGHADSNGAWPALLGESPVQVRRGEIRVGERRVTGSDLACLFLRPRPGSDRACVGVVTGTGVAGLKLTDRLSYFLAGVAYPDVTILGPEMLTKGAEGIRAAGFFGLDWSVAEGEFAWRN